MNYLYNGVELPALPETDYPWAIIEVTNGTHYLWLGSDVYAKTTVGTEGFLVTAPRTCYHVVSGKWVLTGQEVYDDNAYIIPGTNEPIWTNRDLIRLDGSIYLAASDPIPVGGEPTDPTSFYFLSGLLFAQKVGLSLAYKQLSLNGLCDINNILLKSLDDFFLIPNEEEE